jgi:hypothetical protein
MVANDAANLRPAQFTLHCVMRPAGPPASFSGYVAKNKTSGWTDGGWVFCNIDGTSGHIGTFIDVYNTHFAKATGITGGVWHLFTSVYDDSTISFYVDGVLQGTGSYSSSGPNYTLGKPLVLNGYNQGTANTYTVNATVQYAEVSLYGQAHNASQLAQFHSYVQSRYALP